MARFSDHRGSHAESPLEGAHAPCALKIIFPCKIAENCRKARGKKTCRSAQEPININRGEQFAPHFLSISPNNRIPAILDPDGPGGKPITIFESGAILQYLGRKTGKFYPKDERRRVEVDEWLFWQVSGLGPMAGQAHHFRGYASDQIPYAVGR